MSSKIVARTASNSEFEETHIRGVDDDATQGIRMIEAQGRRQDALAEYNRQMGVEDGEILWAMPSKRR